jgi:hypothetical protein
MRIIALGKIVVRLGAPAASLCLATFRLLKAVRLLWPYMLGFDDHHTVQIFSEVWSIC